MAAVWTRLLLLGVFVAVAHGLTCDRCPIAIFGQCLLPRYDVHCNTSTSSCFNETMLFNATDFIRLQRQGCVPSTACDQTEAGAFLGIGYTFSVACCGTDLCNGGTSRSHPYSGGVSVQLSLAAAFVAVLASLWAR
ncbi:sperm acrosome membrane-associated protein 4-like isoform X2 [Gadus macrocephalus]|uniref:sperm acrosome membrane-associated protein 4-like isoform X2 n=1 Tax=Gadus macrocephalus TaxID=80720 RepID=UPI0028CB582B|nr:sperm acrosome membrane-associated protein 4-like isoform X2 [Gadus macrocephalus]